jgi:lysophospholipase L1-like esterase
MKINKKKLIDISLLVIITVILLEITCRIFIFAYLKKTIPPKNFTQMFYRSNFFYYVGGLFIDHSIYDYNLYELTHLKPESTNDINADGYRGKAVPVKKPKGTIRILCLGNSTTFGIGLTQEESYPYLLEKMLNVLLPNHTFEVINGGVPSTNSIEAKRRYQVKFIHYDPDIILWRTDFRLTDNLYLPQITFWDKAFFKIKKAIAKSCLVNILMLPLKTGTYFDYPTRKLTTPKGIRSNYDLVKILAHKQGARIIPIDYLSLDLTTNRIKSPVFERFSIYLPTEDNYIKTLPAFINSGVPTDELFFDEVHLTKKGNAIMAKAIAHYLINNNIIENLD